VTLVLLVGACTSTPPPQPDTRSAAPPEPASIPAAPVPATPTPADYKRRLAEHLHSSNANFVYEGRPPNPLRAVIVYQTEIDSSGRPATIRLYRSPGAPALEARVVESLHRAAPFPPPPSPLLRNGRFLLTETWLFDYGGRFRLRTLALPQDPDAGG